MVGYSYSTGSQLHIKLRMDTGTGILFDFDTVRPPKQIFHGDIEDG